jgi:hypothetical protein
MDGSGDFNLALFARGARALDLHVSAVKIPRQRSAREKGLSIPTTGDFARG